MLTLIRFLWTSRKVPNALNTYIHFQIGHPVIIAPIYIVLIVCPPIEAIYRFQ